ncbi:neurotensin/neuromedin N [Neoarius graeffei]|uniref:neurotensin/neuromedin N n=1 Tax=Neoarius graeffei TaxID=443677 RepID=UPI00298CF9B1|nr:neurotensin/neuromedin N [Neoarius graeffei]
MSVQLTFVVFLFLTISGLCSDTDQAKEAMEEEILSSLFTSEVQQSRHSSPLWQMPVLNMCQILARVSEPWQDEWYANKIQPAYSQRVSTAVSKTLQELYDLLTLCRVIQLREPDLEMDQNNDRPLKRKSPYILKRQLHTKKARRPYILKRSSFY